MSELARMTQSALKEATKATSKNGALSDPKKLAAAGSASRLCQSR